MGKSFASYTDLECGDWGCNREAVEVTDGWADQWQVKEPVEQFKRALVCGIHRGAAKRQAKATRWSKARPEPTFSPASSRPDLVALILAERKAKHDENVLKAEAQRKENALRAQAAFAQEWVERSTEAPFVIEPNPESRSYSDRYRDGFIVRKVDEREGSWDSNHIDVEQDGNKPAIVRIRSNGNMSPNKARAVAQALILAANRADERDLINGPK